MDRSRLLWEIEQWTGNRYLGVPDLKKQHPEFAAAFPRLGTIEGLQALLDHLKSGKPLEQKPKPHRKRGPARKAKLTPEEMTELQAQGKSLSEIAKVAGISKEGVRLAILALRKGEK